MDFETTSDRMEKGKEVKQMVAQALQSKATLKAIYDRLGVIKAEVEADQVTYTTDDVAKVDERIAQLQSVVAQLSVDVGN